MYKLVILIEPQDHPADFDGQWPLFLAAAERMPGLRREVTSRVDRVLHGSFAAHLLHELYFDSLTAAGQAMGSPEGQHAGQILQQISRGKVTLLLADHLEDEVAAFLGQPPAQPPTDRA